MPMLLDREYKIPSKYNSKISLKVVPGHFATSQSHINFYMDNTGIDFNSKDLEENLNITSIDFNKVKQVFCDFIKIEEN